MSFRAMFDHLMTISFLAAAGASVTSIVSAQDLYNEASIFITGTNVYLDGSIHNEGNVQNDGMISLTGDWKNEGKYDGTGALELSGNTPQIIHHRNRTVHTLVIDGWGTKYIKGKLKVEAEFHLKHGIVEVSPDDELKLEQRALIAGGSADSYVDGALTVKGVGYKFFPIGKNGIYAPIELLNVQGNISEYSVEVFEDAPVISFGDVIVRKALYWRRTDIEGDFGGSAIAIDYDRNYFEDPEKITLLAGTSWNESFTTIRDLEHSAETDKIATLSAVSAPIIMLGETSERWTEADFYLSTALSPHASRHANQHIRIFGERLAADQFRFQVFNRWGDIVFESISLEEMTANGWDGRINGGVELPGGTYPYRLSAHDKTGRKFEKKGVITIIY